MHPWAHSEMPAHPLPICFASLFVSLGLKRYRDEKNLAAIRETEEDAKIVMKEMVATELNYMSKVFMQNLKAINLAPDVKDISYYIMEELSQNTSLTLNSALNPGGSFNVESVLREKERHTIESASGSSLVAALSLFER